MLMIKLVDARKGLHEKCVELFHNEKVAESIYMYLCNGLEECDVVELKQKTGRWLEASNEQAYYYSCSECGYGSDWEDNFCPNCGAVMKEEEQDGIR